MADFRELCAELVAWADKTSAHYYQSPDVLIRARAALAEPDGPAVQSREPASVVEQPSDDAVECWADDQGFIRGHAEHPCGFWISDGDIGEIARAILARWGNYPATPDRSLDPIPVSERLPEAGDCDAEGRCWWRDEHIFNLADACALYKQGGTWEFAEKDLLGFVQKVIEEHEKYRDHDLANPAYALPLPKEVE
jgi:hypothetical protein